MSYIDVTGKTEEEAVAKALAQLSLDRDDVSVEILERAKSGFLGIGSAPACVRVSYESAETAEPAAVAPRPAVATKAAVAPQATVASQGTVPPQAAVATQATVAPKATVPPRTAVATPAAVASQGTVPPQATVASQGTVPTQAERGEECSDEHSVRIRSFLEGLLQHLESPAEIKIYQPEKGHYKVYLDGSRPGQLIGRRGETLDAIQQLTNYAVNRGESTRVRIHLDAENYREKREESLSHLAEKVAEKVVKYRRSVTLEPMNAYERHVIHTVLQEQPHIATCSTGTEPNRRVVVSYDRNKQ